MPPLEPDIDSNIVVNNSSNSPDFTNVNSNSKAMKRVSHSNIPKLSKDSQEIYYF